MTIYCKFADPDAVFDYSHGGAIFDPNETCSTCRFTMEQMRRDVPLAARLLRSVADERHYGPAEWSDLVGTAPLPAPKHVCPNARCAADHERLDGLRTENARLKDVVAGYAGSGQRMQDLSDDVGLLESSNKNLSAEIERLREMLSDVANSGVQLPAEPPGLTYATVQIEGELWERIGKEFGQ